MSKHGVWLALTVVLLVACSSDDEEANLPDNHNHGVYMLLDTSGTYTNQLKKAQQVAAEMVDRRYRLVESRPAAQGGSPMRDLVITVRGGGNGAQRLPSGNGGAARAGAVPSAGREIHEVYGRRH